MKPVVLRPAARQDRREEVRYYRKEAGNQVANRLLEAIVKALRELQLNPSIGSPSTGQSLDIPGMRTWRIDGFPLSLWYFERDAIVDVTRLVGQRLDAEFISL